MACFRYTHWIGWIGYRNDIIDSEQPMHIGDLLLFKRVHNLSKGRYSYKPATDQYRKTTTNTTELNTSELFRLLQKSAVEHMTIFRELEV